MQNTPKIPSGSDMAKEAGKQLAKEAAAKIQAARDKYAPLAKAKAEEVAQKAVDYSQSEKGQGQIAKAKDFARKDSTKFLGTAMAAGAALTMLTGNASKVMDLNSKVGAIENENKITMQSVDMKLKDGKGELERWRDREAAKNNKVLTSAEKAQSDVYLANMLKFGKEGFTKEAEQNVKYRNEALGLDSLKEQSGKANSDATTTFLVGGALGGAFAFKKKKDGELNKDSKDNIPGTEPTQELILENGHKNEAKEYVSEPYITENGMPDLSEPIAGAYPMEKKQTFDTGFPARRYGPQEAPIVVEPVIEKPIAAPVKQSIFKSAGQWATRLAMGASLFMGGAKGLEALNANKPVNIADEGVGEEQVQESKVERTAPGIEVVDSETTITEKTKRDGSLVAKYLFSLNTQGENALEDENKLMSDVIDNNTPLHFLKVETIMRNAGIANISPSEMESLKKFLTYNQGTSIADQTKALLTAAPEVRAPSIETSTPVVAEKVAEVTTNIASEGTPEVTTTSTEAPKSQEPISPEYAAAKIKVEAAAAETGAGAKYTEYTKKVTQELITNLTATLAEKGGTMSEQEVKILNAKINAAKYLNSHVVDGKMYVTIAESAKATFMEAANGNPNSIFAQAAEAKYGNFNLVKVGSYNFDGVTMDKSGVQDFLQKYAEISRS